MTVATAEDLPRLLAQVQIQIIEALEKLDALGDGLEEPHLIIDLGAAIAKLERAGDIVTETIVITEPRS